MSQHETLFPGANNYRVMGQGQKVERTLIGKTILTPWTHQTQPKSGLTKLIQDFLDQTTKKKKKHTIVLYIFVLWMIKNQM